MIELAGGIRSKEGSPATAEPSFFCALAAPSPGTTHRSSSTPRRQGRMHHPGSQ